MNLKARYPATGSHVKWLEAWKRNMESVVDFAEDSPEQVSSYATIYALADLLATKPAKSLEDLAAQIE